MTINFNPQFQRFEVFGNDPVVRNSGPQPEFVCKNKSEAIKYCVSCLFGQSTQPSRVLNYMIDNQSITARDIWDLFGAGSPRRVMSTIRKSGLLEQVGMEITDVHEEGHNRFGEPTWYKRYILKEVQNEEG